MESNRGEPLLTVGEAASRLGVHENTVRNWVKNGTLRPVQLAGSRHRRFDAREVERLRGSRERAAENLVAERIRVGPELVNAMALDAWAATKDAQSAFPELVRRLLAATPGVTGISMRTHEGTSAPGWDGRVDSAGTAAYLAAGPLRFELGVNKDVKAKATEEYEKRRDEADESSRRLTFVFATPRRWAGAQAWADARSSEGVFADVRAMDADDIAGWLTSVPAVHYWISERLGRQPKDAETLSTWWRRFAARTSPPLAPELFLAGRDSEANAVHRFFESDDRALTVRAPWSGDVLGFLAASSQAMTDRDLSILIVRTRDAWDRLVTSAPPTLLIADMEDPPLEEAHNRGHRVILVAHGDRVAENPKIELRRIGRPQATDVLRDAGVDSDRAYRYAGLGRRSMPALVRKLARDPLRARPPWGRAPDSDVLGPLALIGGWASSDEDRAAVAEYLGRDWDEAERVLRRWSRTEDPPFVESGTEWHLASAEETLSIFLPHLTAGDLERWHRLVRDVLGNVEPRLQLPRDERPFAGLRDDLPRVPSDVLKSALASSIALLGATEEDELADGRSAQEHARLAVRGLLVAANEDGTALVWRSLSPILPRLAEGAPGDFLGAVAADLESGSSVLTQLFEDGGDFSSMWSTSGHTGLLWALEVLCWSSEWIFDAARALAALCLIDPGGRLSNRPLASLRNVLVGWIRHTSAPRDDVLTVISSLCREFPDVGWSLLMELWPENHGVAFPPSSPRFRDWTPDSRNVTVAQLHEHVACLAGEAVTLAEADARRWAQLLTKLHTVPPEVRGKLLDRLADLVARESFDEQARLELFKAGRDEVARHERFAKADWAMSGPSLERLSSLVAELEPGQRPERFSYLFDWHPDLQGQEPDVLDHEQYSRRLVALRTDALREVLGGAGFDGVARIAADAPVPSAVGEALASLERANIDGEVLNLLDSPPPLSEFAAAWLSRKLWDNGVAWMESALARSDMTDTERRLRFAAAVPATDDFIGALEEYADLGDHFWRYVSPWRISSQNPEAVVRRLLNADRPWAALEFVTGRLHGDGDRTGLTAPLVTNVLDAVLAYDGSERVPQSPGHEIDSLLTLLRESETGDEIVARYEFGFFEALEHHYPPRSLWRILDAEPSTFVELVKRVYRGRSEAPRELSEHDQRVAEQSWRVLHHWRGLPGLHDDGSVDAEHLTRWVRDARYELSEADRADIGDQEVGRVLAASPTGADGVWPAEPVRDLIESIGSREMELGFTVGVANDRGITSRGVFDGGQQERALASRYLEWAQATRSHWRRTSGLLRQLAEQYEADARREDAEARIRGDTD